MHVFMRVVSSQWRDLLTRSLHTRPLLLHEQTGCIAAHLDSGDINGSKATGPLTNGSKSPCTPFTYRPADIVLVVSYDIQAI